MSKSLPSRTKSIFAHKQTYSQKGNSKSLSVASIIDELERMEGACPHVLDPQPPTILEGMQPRDLLKMMTDRIKDQSRILRQMRKDFPEKKGMLRGIRTDTHVLIAAVYSFPDRIEEMDEAEYLAWREDVINFVKQDALNNELEIMAIVEHRDESHPHLHILSLPLITQANPRMNAKLCHEGHIAQNKHIANDWSGSPSRSYKQAMRGWQDAYHRDVGSKHGQARTGPKRRRMDRATWKTEQSRIGLLKDTQKAERRAQASASRAALAEAREAAMAERTAAQRLQKVELVQRLADEGLVEALRVTKVEERLISKVTKQIASGGYVTRNTDENHELHATVIPIIQYGLDALNNLKSAENLVNRFNELVAFVTDWVQHLTEVMPRWLRWGEVVDRIARTAQQDFGWTYRPDSLAEVVEASPVWRDIEASAKRELHRARDVAAMTAHDAMNPRSKPRSGFRFGID